MCKIESNRESSQSYYGISISYRNRPRHVLESRDLIRIVPDMFWNIDIVSGGENPVSHNADCNAQPKDFIECQEWNPTQVYPYDKVWTEMPGEGEEEEKESKWCSTTPINRGPFWMFFFFAKSISFGKTSTLIFSICYKLRKFYPLHTGKIGDILDIWLSKQTL